MSFTPYFDTDIQETIDTENLHLMVEQIRNMNMQQINHTHKDFETECMIDPQFSQTKAFRVGCKAIARAIQRCRHRGEYLIEDIGPPVTLFGIIGAAMDGWMLGDEFAKRWNGHRSGFD